MLEEGVEVEVEEVVMLVVDVVFVVFHVGVVFFLLHCLLVRCVSGTSRQ